MALEIEHIRTKSLKVSTSEIYATFSAACSPYINDELCALRLWSPNYMEFASPLVVCALLGPAAIHAATKSNGAQHLGSETMHFLEGQVLISVLKRFGDYWPLGSTVQGM